MLRENPTKLIGIDKILILAILTTLKGKQNVYLKIPLLIVNKDLFVCFFNQPGKHRVASTEQEICENKLLVMKNKN